MSANNVLLTERNSVGFPKFNLLKGEVTCAVSSSWHQLEPLLSPDPRSRPNLCPRRRLLRCQSLRGPASTSAARPATPGTRTAFRRSSGARCLQHLLSRSLAPCRSPTSHKASLAAATSATIFRSTNGWWASKARSTARPSEETLSLLRLQISKPTLPSKVLSV